MDRTKQKITLALAALWASLSLTGCFTGVEGTSRIGLPQREVAAARMVREDYMVDSLPVLEVSQWRPGRLFRALDNRTALIFEPRTLPPNPLYLQMAGKTVTFKEIRTSTTSGGESRHVVVFTDPEREYLYTVPRDTLTNFDIPMMVDCEVTAEIDRRLRGRTVWVKTQVWTGPSGQNLIGDKFIPVKVDSVTAGRETIPLLVHFTDSAMGPAAVSVNFSRSRTDSRSFSSQFSLSDPRQLYPSIDDNTWALIQKGKIREGMTKAECRLSLGNPSDVTSGSSHSYLYDLWQYPDGSWLMFADGVLTRYSSQKDPLRPNE